MESVPRSIRFIWLAACVVVLLWWTIAYGFNDAVPKQLRAESQVYLFIAIIVLSFPAGLIWAVFVAIGSRALYELGFAPDGSIWVNTFIYWLGAVVLGYLQWFVLVPRYTARRRTR